MNFKNIAWNFLIGIEFLVIMFQGIPRIVILILETNTPIGF